MSDDARDAVRIAPATPRDARVLAHLWHEAFEPGLHYILGSAALPILEDWLPADPTLFDDCLIAWAGDEPAGFIQFREKAPPELAKFPVLWKILRKYFSPIGCLKRAVQLWLSELVHPYHPEELYVYMLGVTRAYRRRRIAWQLLERAEVEARVRNKKRIKINTLAGNMPAITLYEQFGFEKSPVITSRLIRWADGTGAYHLMTKRLDGG